MEKKPRYKEQISPVPWHLIKSWFHCNEVNGHLTLTVYWK